MRTPITLIIPAAVFGIVVPVVSSSATAQLGNPSVAALLSVFIWAMIPVVATVIGYKQGYERGLAKGRKSKRSEEARG